MFLPAALLPTFAENKLSADMALNEAGRTGKTYVNGVPKTLNELSDPLALTSAAQLLTQNRNADKGDDYADKPSGVPWSVLTADRHGGSSAAALDYLNADLAKHYKMDASTAYQEALSNTGYQRAVKDMQAAGLNPAALFGSGHVSSADGVAYVSPVSSGGSGSGSRYGSSAKSKAFSSSAYSAIVNLAGLAGLGLTKKYSGYLGGTTAAKGILSFIDALNR